MKANASAARQPGREAWFDGGWLALREPVDADSRSARLTSAAAHWLARRAPPHELLDLGSGAGANPRYLAPRLPGPQRWRLVDHDPQLLADAAARLAGLQDGSGRPARVATVPRGVSPVDAHLLQDADLVVASALLDLVSASWLDALVDACAQRRAALLISLSVDGDWAFLDGAGNRVDDADDARLRDLFRGHQCRDKGLGAALGGEAPQRLARALAGAGFRVETQASHWRLSGRDVGHQRLAEALLAGWRDAALEVSGREDEWVRCWHDRRREAVLAGRLGVHVGHRDLFATPPEDVGA